MTDDLLSNRFAHLFEPAAVLKAVNDRGNVRSLEVRMVRKLGPADAPDEDDDGAFEPSARRALKR